jgi:hypothetical protein
MKVIHDAQQVVFPKKHRCGYTHTYIQKNVMMRSAVINTGIANYNRLLRREQNVTYKQVSVSMAPKSPFVPP